MKKVTRALIEEILSVVEPGDIAEAIARALSEMQSEIARLEGLVADVGKGGQLENWKDLTLKWLASHDEVCDEAYEHILYVMDEAHPDIFPKAIEGYRDWIASNIDEIRRQEFIPPAWMEAMERLAAERESQGESESE